MPTTNKCFPVTAFLDQHSHPKTNNWLPVGTSRTQTNEVNRSIALFPTFFRQRKKKKKIDGKVRSQKVQERASRRQQQQQEEQQQQKKKTSQTENPKQKRQRLTMNVATDFDRGLQLQQDGLTDENFARFHTQRPNLIFLQIHLRAWFAAFNCQQSLNAMRNESISTTKSNH
jgi:hypothetical protein